MVQKKLFGTQLFDKRAHILIGAIILLFVFDLIAIWNSLYFYHRWVDIPVHATAGFLVAMTFFFLVFQNQQTRNVFRRVKIDKEVFTVCVFWSFVVAFLWEIFELLIGRTRVGLSSSSDMLLDIVATTVGAFIFYIIYRLLSNRRRPLDRVTENHSE